MPIITRGYYMAGIRRIKGACLIGEYIGRYLSMEIDETTYRGRPTIWLIDLGFNVNAYQPV